MPKNIDYSDFRVAIGASTEKDSYKAGKEVSEMVLKKLGGKPDFLLLFCTLEYEDNGGLDNLLKGAWKNLPEETTLLGGTVSGFLAPSGCYAKGTVALACSYPNMNIVVGHGKNTKRNPTKAAKNCVKMIGKGLKNQYSEKVILSFIPSMKNQPIPGIKDISFISSKMLAFVSLGLLSVIQKTIQKGLGREQEVVEKITEKLPDFKLIHGSITSGAPYERNFQFLNKKIFKESALMLAIETDIPCYLNFATGAKKTDKKFKITKISKDKRIIKKINNKPAFPEFLKLMNWSTKSIGDFKWTDRVVRHPIAFERNSRILLRPTLLILGNYMGAVGKIEGNDAFIADMNSENIAAATDEVLEPEKPVFGFFSSCFSQKDFLGIKVFQVQEKLKQYFQDKPFLLLYVGGEGMYKPDEGFYFLTESLTSAIFHEG